MILIDPYTQNQRQDVSLLLIKFLLFMFMLKGLITHQRKQHKVDLGQLN